MSALGRSQLPRSCRKQRPPPPLPFRHPSGAYVPVSALLPLVAGTLPADNLNPALAQRVLLQLITTLLLATTAPALPPAGTQAVHTTQGPCPPHLAADGAQAHAARAEPAHDVRRGLHLLNGHRGAVADQLQAVAQHRHWALLKVLHEGLVGGGVGGAAGAQADGLVQQLGHGLVVGVELALGLGLDEAIVLQLGHGLVREAL